MNGPRGLSANPQRALFYLIILTISILAVMVLLPNTSAKPAAPIVAAALALLKVRLVVLDFLGLRSRGAHTRRALIAWAAVVLAIALVKVIAFSAVFAN
ncbi:cytochrome C oxidase subunit IV family protein [Rhizobium sp. R693]|uniref:cytochrome C oxidase subunit IV family protein n=1 Tax=Rhizobium sp. R693 TaxID=1764276 RepID=UPI000B536DBA|nr:cytochrome C oxidase subunit IV family protein [Rhizobium sp. R693]OWV84658.1 hypothetical protein ATY79_12180 [Rhizobium sp. R693]